MKNIDIQNLSNYNLFVDIKKSFLKLIKNKICEKFGSVRSFALSDGIYSQSFYCNVFNDKRSARIIFWLNLCKMFNITLEEFRDNFIKIRNKHTGFILSKSLPISLSDDLASLVGHALGDGHIDEELSYFSYTNNSPELHNEVKSLISNFCVFKPCEIYHKALTVTYPSIVASILNLAGVPNGNKIIKDFSTPQWILNGSKNIKIAFLRALFDDEGSVKRPSHEILLKLSKNESHLNSLLYFMEQIKNLLEEVGLKPSSIKRGNIFTGKNGKTIQLVLGIYGYKNFVKFSNTISFSSYRKRQELKELINGYQRIKLRSGEGQAFIYEKLVEPKTIYSLAKELNISTIAVYKHLRKLQNKKIVVQNQFKRNEPAFWSRSNG